MRAAMMLSTFGSPPTPSDAELRRDVDPTRRYFGHFVDGSVEDGARREGSVSEAETRSALLVQQTPRDRRLGLLAQSRIGNGEPQHELPCLFETRVRCI
jgi:hypothetical protein